MSGQPQREMPGMRLHDLAGLLLLTVVPTLQVQAQPGGRQVVLSFRVRIDNPSTVGSCNMLKIELSGQAVGLTTPQAAVIVADP